MNQEEKNTKKDSFDEDFYRFEEKVSAFLDKVGDTAEKIHNLSIKMDKMVLARQLQSTGFSKEGVLSMQEVVQTQDPKLVLKYMKLCLNIHPHKKENTKEQGGEIGE